MSDDAKGQVEVGLRLSIQAAGKLKGAWFYQAQSETGDHVLRLWDKDGKQIAQSEAPAVATPGWQYAAFPTPVTVQAGQVLVLSYTASSHYVATTEAFAKPIVRPGITAETGLYSFDELGKMPVKTYQNMSYFLDVAYEKGEAE